MFRWFYFNRERFVHTNAIGFKGGRWVAPKDFFGGVLFCASTAQRGEKGYGDIYLATPEGLLKLGHPREVASFIQLFVPHELSGEHARRLKKLLDWGKSVKELIPYGRRVSWTQAVKELLEELVDYLGRLLCMRDRDRGLRQMEKLLHQLYILFKIPKAAGGEILDETISIRQRMGCGIEWLDAIMPVTWGWPTFKFRTYEGTTYSVWYELQVPHPIDPELKRKALARIKYLDEIMSEVRRGSIRRLDIVVQKGNHDTMFQKRPWDIYERLKSMNWKERIELPNYFFERMKRIDLLIECKERPFIEWKSEVEEQVIPYYETYKPKRMALVSAHPVPERVKLRLEKVGIAVVAPFGPEEVPYEQESILKELIKEL